MAPKKKNVPSTPKALTTRSAAKTKNAIEDDTPDATSGGELVVARPHKSTPRDPPRDYFNERCRQSTMHCLALRYASQHARCQDLTVSKLVTLFPGLFRDKRGSTAFSRHKIDQTSLRKALICVLEALKIGTIPIQANEYSFANAFALSLVSGSNSGIGGDDASAPAAAGGIRQFGASGAGVTTATTTTAGFGAADTATARHAIFGGATGGEIAAAAAAAPRAFGGGFETGFGAAATKTKTAEAAPTQSVFGGGVGGLSLAGGTAQNQEPPVFGRTNTGGTAPPPGQSIFTAATQQQTRMGFGLGATTPADQPAPTPGPGGGLQERTTNGACTTAAAGSPFASAFGNKSGGKSDNIANVPQEPDLTNMSGAKLQRLKEQVAREESKRTEGFGWGPDPRAHGSGNGCGSHIGGDPNGGGGGGGVNGQEAVEIIGAITDLTKVLHGGKAVATMAPPQPQPQPQSQPREVLDAATGTDILDAEDAAAADCASPAFQTPARRPPRADLPWSFGKTAGTGRHNAMSDITTQTGGSAVSAGTVAIIESHQRAFDTKVDLEEKKMNLIKAHKREEEQWIKERMEAKNRNEDEAVSDLKKLHKEKEGQFERSAKKINEARAEEYRLTMQALAADATGRGAAENLGLHGILFEQSNRAFGQSIKVVENNGTCQ